MKYLAAIFLFMLPLAACDSGKQVPAPAPVSPSEPRDCDEPSRDENGRPVDLC